MRKSHLLFVIWSLTVLVGLYQVPLLENTIVKYNGYVNLTQYFPYSQQVQQLVEDAKISLMSKLDNVEETNNVAQLQNASIGETEVKTMMLTAPVKEDKCTENCKVLMIGDSVMGDVSYALERLAKKSNPSWKIIDAHKVSSGLTNKTYYDWQKTATKLLEKNKPDYVILMMGANDAQGIVSNGRPYKISDVAWSEEYKSRVDELTNLINEKNDFWWWVELPVVKESKFNTKLQKVRDLQASGAKEHLLETASIFGNTNHTEPIDMKLRSNDGVHLNSSGADLVAKHIFKEINK